MTNCKNKQNRAARVITRSTYETSTTVLLDNLCWEQLQTRRKKQKTVTVFKAIHKLTPVYLQNLFTPRSTEYFIRDHENKLYLAKPRTEYLKCSFSYSGALLGMTFQRRCETSVLYQTLRERYTNLLSNRIPTRQSRKTFSSLILYVNNTVRILL